MKGEFTISRREDLTTLINEYKVEKDKENKLVKNNKEVGNKIKSLLLDEKLEEYDTGTYIAKLDSKDKYDFNEDKAIEILKQSLAPELLSKVIRTKEYIDDDELETLIYNKEFDMNKLQECNEYKNTTYTLRINKKKGDK